MKKIIPIILLGLSFSFQVNAQSCSVINMIKAKIEKQIDQRTQLEEAISLNDKLTEINSWQEWTNIEVKERRISLEEAESVFSAKEIDMLILADTLNLQEDVIYGDLTINVGVMAGSVAASFVTAKVINKLLLGGFKSGFMKKLQTMIGADKDNQKKARKIKMVTNILAFMAPAYLGYKEYQLYSMLKDLQKKIELVDQLNSRLPELEILDERISSDQIMLRKFQSNLKESCD